MRRLGPHGLVLLQPTNATASVSGAESAAEAGTSTSIVRVIPQLSPLGLAIRPRVITSRLTDATPIGAASTAEAGVVLASGTTAAVISQFGPCGLTNRVRQFSPKQAGQQNASATPVGAYIQGQSADPDSSAPTTFIDGAAISGDAGLVTDSVAFVQNAVIAGQAGSVSTATDIDAVIVSAEIIAAHGDVAGIGNFSGLGTPVGAEIGADAGAVVGTAGVNAAVQGGFINAQASEVGIDNDSQLSVTVTGLELTAQAGVIFDDFGSVQAFVTGAAINAEGGPVIFATDIPKIAYHDIDFSSSSYGMTFVSE